MSYRVSRSEQIVTALKIIIGFAQVRHWCMYHLLPHFLCLRPYVLRLQVLKDAPRLLQEEDQFPSSWRFLSFVTIDPALLVPACILPISYYWRFIANTVICPAFLMVVVSVTLFTTKAPLEGVDLAPSELLWQKQRRHTEQLSRLYFAFFLAYPMQAQTFFSHVRQHPTFMIT